VRWRARAEFFEVEKMLHYRDTEYARTASIESPMRRTMERSAIALTIGEAMNLSEGQVVHKLAAAERIRQHTPHVWDAFGDGLIDFARIRDISATVDALQREESIFRLDQTVVLYAMDHTGAELRRCRRSCATSTTENPGPTAPPTATTSARSAEGITATRDTACCTGPPHHRADRNRS
jgi:hypothetical protein